MSSGKKFWSGFFSGGAAALALAMLVVMLLAIPAYISLLGSTSGSEPSLTIDGVPYYYREGYYYDAEGNRLKPYFMTYIPEKGMSKRQI